MFLNFDVTLLCHANWDFKLHEKLLRMPTQPCFCFFSPPPHTPNDSTSRSTPHHIIIHRFSEERVITDFTLTALSTGHSENIDPKSAIFIMFILTGLSMFWRRFSCEVLNKKNCACFSTELPKPWGGNSIICFQIYIPEKGLSSAFFFSL